MEPTTAHLLSRVQSKITSTRTGSQKGVPHVFGGGSCKVNKRSKSSRRDGCSASLKKEEENVHGEAYAQHKVIEFLHALILAARGT